MSRVFPLPLDLCATPLAALLLRLMETVLAHSNSQILYHSILGCLFRALSPRSHVEFKSFSEAKRCDSVWDSPLALSLPLLLSSSLFSFLSLSLTYFSSLYFPLLCSSTQESWGAGSAVNQFHLVCFPTFIQSRHAQRFQKPHDTFIGA